MFTNYLIKNHRIFSNVFLNSQKLIKTVPNLSKNQFSTKNQTELVKKPNDSIVKENEHIANVYSHVNNLIEDPRLSRLFAVVMVGGSQFKITTEDIIVVRNHFYPTIGDKIRLEKVLLVGGKDFSVVGKPLLSKEFVKVEATVIEKTLSNTVYMFKYKQRKDNRHMDFYKGILTLLRINSIEIIGRFPNDV